MIPVMGDIQNTQIRSNRKQNNCQPGKGVGSVCLMGTSFILGWWQCPGITDNDCTVFLTILRVTKLGIFKWLKWSILRVFYHDFLKSYRRPRRQGQVWEGKGTSGCAAQGPHDGSLTLLCRYSPRLQPSQPWRQQVWQLCCLQCWVWEIDSPPRTIDRSGLQKATLVVTPLSAMGSFPSSSSFRAERGDVTSRAHADRGEPPPRHSQQSPPDRNFAAEEWGRETKVSWEGRVGPCCSPCLGEGAWKVTPARALGESRFSLKMEMPAWVHTTSQQLSDPPWAGHIASLSRSFPIWKLGLMVVC